MPLPSLSTAARNLALVSRYQQGDPDSGEELLRVNVGLVARIARQYLSGAGSLEFDDLLIEGQIGLLRAAVRFDCSRGIAFSTYCVPWVRQCICRALETQSAMIRLPVSTAQNARRINAAREGFIARHGREPELAEIAAVTGLPLRAVRNLSSLPEQPISLDMPVNDDGDLLGSLLESPAPSVEAQVVEGSPVESLLGVHARDLLEGCDLSRKERAVVEMRFGFDSGGDGKTLQEIADGLSMSREGIRHVQTRALRKLRAAAGV